MAMWMKFEDGSEDDEINMKLVKMKLDDQEEKADKVANVRDIEEEQCQKYIGTIDG